MQFIDKDTDLHCKRVEALIAGFIKANPDVFTLKEELITAARIHDIGKNRIPDEILNSVIIKILLLLLLGIILQVFRIRHFTIVKI